MKKTAKAGDTVTVHYKGTLEDGSEFDSSEGSEPLEFTIGAQQVIDGFENAIVGMAEGERKRESIPPENAYGAHDENLLFQVPRSALEPETEVEAGDVVHVTMPDGETAPMHVVQLDDSSLVLDANHPLAGQTLVFDLELVSIKDGD